jgi:hypothetical protein
LEILLLPESFIFWDTAPCSPVTFTEVNGVKSHKRELFIVTAERN